MEMKRLFEPYTMKSLTLANRIVFAGHGSRFVDPNTMLPTPRQAEYLAERARGGAGLVIQGSCIIHPTGLTVGGTHQLWNDDCIPAYAELARAVHAEGVPIFGQLSHLGRNGVGFANQREMWAPSAVPEPTCKIVPRAMTHDQIAEIVDAYRSAALRLVKAGFDGFEVYMAHGYLLCSFLSPHSNFRDDEYGGSFENRLRFPLQVLRAVRNAVGPDRPIGIRVSAEEFVGDGLNPEAAEDIVKALCQEVDVDYVSVSQSNFSSIDRQIPDMSFPKTPFVDYASRIRKVTSGIPVFTVGRIVDPERAEELLEDGVADFVALVRPLIADPYLPRKTQAGQLSQVRRCISCNVGCRGGPHRGLPIACLVNPAVGYERERGEGRLAPAETPKRVLVIGGGPAGLKASETAALRGHSLTLWEASGELGGTTKIAARAAGYRGEFAEAANFMAAECRRLGVDIALNRTATLDGVRAFAPDVVICATGARPGRPDIPRAGTASDIDVADLIAQGYPKDANVLVADCGEGDWRALTTAEGLLEAGNRVTFVSPAPAGSGIDITSRLPILRRLGAGDVTFYEHHGLESIGEHVVQMRDLRSGKVIDLSGIDMVATSWFGRANDDLYHTLREAGLAVELIGDACAPRRAIDAVWDGFRIGAAV
ncbi:MAG: FAD-dependent oxidoreductase [Pseudomonadota bacterium]|nr:FAD-dependent oxidoreductase [Pseudomonadota bacterium]